jgi:hypothetical protein
MPSTWYPPRPAAQALSDRSAAPQTSCDLADPRWAAGGYMILIDNRDVFSVALCTAST